MTDTQERQFVTLAEVCRVTGKSERTIARMVEAGKFPRPAPDMGRSWHRDTFNRWLDRQRTKV